MALKASVGGGSNPVDPGVYPARLVQMIDLGHQEREWQGEKKTPHRILFGFELPTVTEESGGKTRPRILFQEATASLNEKATLYAWIKGWRGRALSEADAEKFDLTKLLDQPCQLNVTVSDKNYNNIDAVLPAPADPPARVSDLIEFDIDTPDMAVLASFSERLQDKIRGSLDWKEPGGEAVAAGGDGEASGADDTPF